jgi:hypothetical protein
MTIDGSRRPPQPQDHQPSDRLEYDLARETDIVNLHSTDPRLHLQTPAISRSWEYPLPVR